MSDTVHRLGAKFDLNENDLLDKFHIDTTSERGTRFQKIIHQAEKKGNPKAIYRVAYITDKGEETVKIDEVEFRSKVLQAQLEEVHRVFPYIATCGKELDEITTDTDSQLESLLLEEIKSKGLEAARTSLYEEIKSNYQLEDFSSMSPGSGGKGVWGIQQQKEFFELFDGEEKTIGVELTKDFLMVPNKSVSGIIYPTDISFESCQLCHRENCPSRQASYDPQLAEEYSLDVGKSF